MVTDGIQAARLFLRAGKRYFDTTAYPQSTGNFGTGNRSFYSNETFVVYQQDGSVTGVWGTAAPPGTRLPASPAVPIE